MRRTPRTALVAIPFVCLLAALLFQSARLETPAVSPAGSPRHPTVEPGLPLRIDLAVRDDRPGSGDPARVEAVIDAADDLREVSLEWVFPEGVRQDAVEDSSPATMRLRSGERRVLNVPVRATREADLPIRLRASFQVADGRWFRTEQGVLWRRGPKTPEGRHHAGAFEVNGVPVSEPLP
jgi:hypothetical protein